MSRSLIVVGIPWIFRFALPSSLHVNFLFWSFVRIVRRMFWRSWVCMLFCRVGGFYGFWEKGV